MPKQLNKSQRYCWKNGPPGIKSFDDPDAGIRRLSRFESLAPRLGLYKDGQEKIADLDSVVVRKDGGPKIALDRSKLRVIDPAEGNRIDYYLGLINDLFVKAN
jgi:hypothetical protein